MQASFASVFSLHGMPALFAQIFGGCSAPEVSFVRHKYSSEFLELNYGQTANSFMARNSDKSSFKTPTVTVTYDRYCASQSFDRTFTICRTEIPEESPTANSAKRAKR